MSSIPGLSIQTKIDIQLKIDKILSDFVSPCSYLIEKTRNLNSKFYSSIISNQNCELIANKSFNFHYKDYPISLFPYLTDLNSFLNDPNRLLVSLFKVFSIKELIILLNNLDIFIKNEEIKNYFPKLKKIEEIYKKKLSNNNNIIKKCKYNLPIIYNYDIRNEINKNFKEDLYNKLKKKIIEKKNEIQKKENIKSKREQLLKNIINNKNKKLLNIRLINKNTQIKHPLVEYHMKNRKKLNSFKNILENKNNKLFKINKNKFLQLFEQNKKQMLYLDDIKKNILEKNKLFFKLNKRNKSNLF